LSLCAAMSTFAAAQEKIQLLLPGYPGQVQPAICHPFTAGEPRVWHRADERGEWVWVWLVGGDRLIEWLDHFGGEYDLGRGDLERFDELAEPSWLRPAIAASLTWSPLLGRPSANPPRE
jgi:hypothetical protein